MKVREIPPLISRYTFLLLPFAWVVVSRIGLCDQTMNASRPTAMQHLITDSIKKGTLENSRALEDEQLAVKDLPMVLDYIQRHPDYKSYHLLFALRRKHVAAYQKISVGIRAAVLCSALKELDFSNDWAEPCQSTIDPFRDYETEQALREIGKPAIHYLLPLLDDRRVFDSESEGEPAEYSYRRADYAFRYISWILGLPYEFRVNPVERDEQIESLKNKLCVGGGRARRKPSGR
jgi:hypothetical protein